MQILVPVILLVILALVPLLLKGKGSQWIYTFILVFAVSFATNEYFIEKGKHYSTVLFIIFTTGILALLLIYRAYISMIRAKFGKKGELTI